MVGRLGLRVLNLEMKLSIQEELLHRNVKRFRGGLVFKAHRLLYHSNLGSGVINKKKRRLFWTEPGVRRSRWPDRSQE